MKEKKAISLQVSKKDLEYLLYLMNALGESQSNTVRSAISHYYYFLKNKESK